MRECDQELKVIAYSLILEVLGRPGLYRSEAPMWCLERWRSGLNRSACLGMFVRTFQLARAGYEGTEQSIKRGKGETRRKGHPAPPRFVLETEHPLRITLGEADQPVAAPSFRAYSGSGLVIQRLARNHRTPIRSKVARTVSALTRSSVMPSSKLASAAKASVHRLGWAYRTPWGSGEASGVTAWLAPRRRWPGSS